MKEAGNSKSCVLLSLRNITKSCDGKVVLQGISIQIHAGEVSAIISGNGNDKKALIKILMGSLQADIGDIIMNGMPANLAGSSHFPSGSMYLIPKVPTIFPNMTVEENILMGMGGRFDILRRRLRGWMAYLGWVRDTKQKAAAISMADQQILEILRALMRESKLLILDEPTLTFTVQEVQNLFDIIKALQLKGIGIVYFTHRVPEVYRVADRALTLNSGRITLDCPVSTLTPEHLLQGLLPPGAKTGSSQNAQNSVQHVNAEPVLTLDQLSGYGFEQVSLKLYAGQILGLFGLEGSGGRELALTMLGRESVRSGHIYLNGSDITGMTTPKVMNKGLQYAAEDTMLDDVFNPGDISAGISPSSPQDISRFFISSREEAKISDYLGDDFQPEVSQTGQTAGSLSALDRKKVMIARAVAYKPKALILCDLSEGLDEEERAEIHGMVKSMKCENMAILLISSDADEIVLLSDHAVTMYSGHLTHEFSKNDIRRSVLTAAAFGIQQAGTAYA